MENIFNHAVVSCRYSDTNKQFLNELKQKFDGENKLNKTEFLNLLVFKAHENFIVNDGKANDSVKAVITNAVTDLEQDATDLANTRLLTIEQLMVEKQEMSYENDNLQLKIDKYVEQAVDNGTDNPTEIIDENDKKLLAIAIKKELSDRSIIVNFENDNFLAIFENIFSKAVNKNWCVSYSDFFEKLINAFISQGYFVEEK